MVIELPLSQGKVALIDDEDAHLAEFKWHARHNGRNLWYAARCVGPQRRTVSLHRVILPGCVQVDHINGDGLDNRRANLRPASARENQFNGRMRADNTTGYKGVTWDARDRVWRARVNAKGRRMSLGSFHDPVEAARAYDEAARRLFGEFAALNFPEDGERAAA